MGPSHLLWIPLGAAVSFAAAFVFGDVLTLPLDVYYLIYFGVLTAFFATYVRRTGLDIAAWIKRRIGWGLVLGSVFGIVMARHVISLPPTEPLTGLSLASAVVWRGLFYGAFDGLLLFSFPWIVTWRALGGESRSLLGKLGVAVLAWGFVLVITTAYHLGYRDSRSPMIVQPNIGSMIAAVPTLVSANPAASPITHVFLHVAAVLHSPDSPLFLPPHRKD